MKFILGFITRPVDIKLQKSPWRVEYFVFVDSIWHSEMASSLPLPIIDLTSLKVLQPSSHDLAVLSKQLGDVFETVGFAYLVNAPLNFGHGHVFGMAEEFFGMPKEEKLKLAKKCFRKENENTYRG